MSYTFAKKSSSNAPWKKPLRYNPKGDFGLVDANAFHRKARLAETVYPTIAVLKPYNLDLDRPFERDYVVQQLMNSMLRNQFANPVWLSDKTVPRMNLQLLPLQSATTVWAPCCGESFIPLCNKYHSILKEEAVLSKFSHSKSAVALAKSRRDRTRAAIQRLEKTTASLAPLPLPGRVYVLCQSAPESQPRWMEPPPELIPKFLDHYSNGDDEITRFVSFTAARDHVGLSLSSKTLLGSWEKYVLKTPLHIATLYNASQFLFDKKLFEIMEKAILEISGKEREMRDRNVRRSLVMHTQGARHAVNDRSDDECSLDFPETHGVDGGSVSENPATTPLELSELLEWDQRMATKSNSTQWQHATSLTEDTCESAVSSKSALSNGSLVNEHTNFLGGTSDEVSPLDWADTEFQEDFVGASECEHNEQKELSLQADECRMDRELDEELHSVNPEIPAVVTSDVIEPCESALEELAAGAAEFADEIEEQVPTNLQCQHDDALIDEVANYDIKCIDAAAVTAEEVEDEILSHQQFIHEIDADVQARTGNSDGTVPHLNDLSIDDTIHLVYGLGSRKERFANALRVMGNGQKPLSTGKTFPREPFFPGDAC